MPGGSATVAARGCLPVPAQQGGGGSARSCAVGGGLVGLAGDGLHAQRSDVIHQPALPAPAGGVQRGPVVGQEPLGHAVGAHALVEDPDGRVTGLGPGDQGGHRQAGVIVLKLEDHALAASLQDVLSGVQLPAGVRSGVDEPPPGRSGPLPGLGAGHVPGPQGPGPGTPPKAPPRTHGDHLVVDADRPVVQARELQGRAYCHRLVRGRLTQTSRTGPGATGPGPPAQPPAPRRGRGPSGRRTSCARSPARRRTWSPPHAERHRATGRWQGEHGGQQAHSYSPAKHNRSVTTTTARTVTDVLTQNCHRSPEASHALCPQKDGRKVRSRDEAPLTLGPAAPLWPAPLSPAPPHHVVTRRCAFQRRRFKRVPSTSASSMCSRPATRAPPLCHSGARTDSRCRAPDSHEDAAPDNRE